MQAVVRLTLLRRGWGRGQAAVPQCSYYWAYSCQRGLSAASREGEETRELYPGQHLHRASAEEYTAPPRARSAGRGGLPVERALYRGHYPLSRAQRVFMAPYAAVSALLTPGRTDMVAALAEVTGTRAMLRMRDKMRADETGRWILQNRPLVNSEQICMEALEQDLPEGTFGHEYIRFMNAHGFDPDKRKRPQYVDDEELAYVILRYRQLHDFWHVLCGLPPTILGEIALKWFELVQTELPIGAFAGIFGQLKLTRDENRLLRRLLVPWAFRSASKAKFLMNVVYEECFHVPIADLRKELNVEPSPPVPMLVREWDGTIDTVPEH